MHMLQIRVPLTAVCKKTEVHIISDRFVFECRLSLATEFNWTVCVCEDKNVCVLWDRLVKIDRGQPGDPLIHVFAFLSSHFR